MVMLTKKVILIGFRLIALQELQEKVPEVQQGTS